LLANFKLDNGIQIVRQRHQHFAVRPIADQTEMALAAVHVLDGTAREWATKIKKKLAANSLISANLIFY
jgi:hypothetical protein